jgi:Flp pilus assembly protein TadG
MIRRRHRSSQKRERGSVLVEAVLGFPLLALLMIGTLEFGMAWRDSTTVATALRTGARTAASLGNSGSADYYALQSLKAGLSGIPAGSITRIIIYNANSTNPQNPAPPTACLSMAAPGGQSTSGAQCNVYTAASLTLPSTSFSTTATGSCPASAVDRYFCPLTRDVSQASVTDYLGIYIQVRHDFVSRMFGTSLTIKDKLIVQLEPL